MAKIDKEKCRRVCAEAGIDLSADFHALNSSAVSALSDMARAVGYRKPANANGSAARYFFAYLNRGQK